MRMKNESTAIKNLSRDKPGYTNLANSIINRTYEDF